jgi:hypothetical protein
MSIRQRDAKWQVVDGDIVGVSVEWRVPLHVEVYFRRVAQRICRFVDDAKQKELRVQKHSSSLDYSEDFVIVVKNSAEVQLAHVKTQR